MNKKTYEDIKPIINKFIKDLCHEYTKDFIENASYVKVEDVVNGVNEMVHDLENLRSKEELICN